MKCTNCGYENVAGASACTYCKHAIGTAPAVVTPSAGPSAGAAAPATGAGSANTATPAPTATPSSAPAYAPASAPTAAPYSAPTYPPASSRPATPSATQQSYNQQQYYYPPVAHRPKQPFTLTDAYIIIGFVLAVVGVFTHAFLLLPASICFSVYGFIRRTNSRTHGLSIAGIVVGVVACIIKIGMVLNELGFIPDWLSAGIF